MIAINYLKKRPKNPPEKQHTKNPLEVMLRERSRNALPHFCYQRDTKSAIERTESYQFIINLQMFTEDAI